jgi:hypothetical protein
MDDTKILVPIWALKSLVERDYQRAIDEYTVGGILIDEMGDLMQEPFKFPEFDSTIELLKILEDHGLTFDTTTGAWS